jgi:predicted small secreted protein
MTLIALAALLGLTACETVGGFGQDVENTGEFVQGTAQEVQEDL